MSGVVAALGAAPGIYPGCSLLTLAPAKMLRQGGIHRSDTDPWTGGGVIFYFFNGRNQVSIGY